MYQHIKDVITLPETGKNKAGKLPGQSRPVDSSTAVFWQNNRRFAEVFSKVVMDGREINPDELIEQDTSEAAMIRVMEDAHITLKKIRDVIKALKSGLRLAILGIEDQKYIDYLMPFRVILSDVINMAKQIAEIQDMHKDDGSKPDENEHLSRFRKSDRISPVITLVIYYAKKEWDGPTKLSDLFIDSPYKDFAADYPMYLLDVRRLSDEEIEEFSPDLKSFFGFLKYENEDTDKLKEFIDNNRDTFVNLSPEITNALVEITKSPELAKIIAENKTSEGGIDMCNGIQYYANQVAEVAANERERKTYIEAAQEFGQSITDTISRFIAKFNVTEEEAQDNIKKYWKET